MYAYGASCTDNWNLLKSERKHKTKLCTVGLKSHDPWAHKKYKAAGVMTIMAHCSGDSTVFTKFIRQHPCFRETFRWNTGEF